MKSSGCVRASNDSKHIPIECPPAKERVKDVQLRLLMLIIPPGAVNQRRTTRTLVDDCHRLLKGFHHNMCPLAVSTLNLLIACSVIQCTINRRDEARYECVGG